VKITFLLLDYLLVPLLPIDASGFCDDALVRSSVASGMFLVAGPFTHDIGLAFFKFHLELPNAPAGGDILLFEFFKSAREVIESRLDDDFGRLVMCGGFGWGGDGGS